MPVAEGEVIEPGRLDLLAREDDLVAIGPVRDRQRAVNHADVPHRPVTAADLQVAQGTVRRSLRREDGAVDDDVAGGEVDARPIRGEDSDEVVVGRRSGERSQIVDAVDRRAIVDIMCARDDHRPDLRRAEPGELGDHALDRALRLGVRVEQVARDQDDVDLLADRELDRGPECRELPLALGRGLLAEIRMARAEMDISGVEESEHPVGLASCAVAGGRRAEVIHRIPGPSSPGTRAAKVPEPTLPSRRVRRIVTDATAPPMDADRPTARPASSRRPGARSLAVRRFSPTRPRVASKSLAVRRASPTAGVPPERGKRADHSKPDCDRCL